MGALRGPSGPTPTGELRSQPTPLPRREGPPRVRLRVRIPVDVLEATIIGLTELDEQQAGVLTAQDVATAPAPADDHLARLRERPAQD